MKTCDKCYAVTIPVLVQTLDEHDAISGVVREGSITFEVPADNERDAVKYIARELAIACKVRFQSFCETEEEAAL